MSAGLTAEEVKSAVLRILGDIAPEADLKSLSPDANFRDQLDLDSMDFLNFVIALHKTFRVEIPEADHPKYASLNGCIEQLTARR